GLLHQTRHICLLYYQNGQIQTILRKWGKSWGVKKSCTPRTTSDDGNRLQRNGNRLQSVEIVTTLHDFKLVCQKRTGNRLQHFCNRLPGCIWCKIHFGKRLQGCCNRLPVCFWLVFEILYCNCGA
ncbi:hypothetical protein VIGAN_06074000, partial [Vigna angularis var. angularis]